MNIQPGGGGGFISLEHMKKSQKKASEVLHEKWKDPIFREKRIMTSSDIFKKLHKEGKIKHDTFTGRLHTDETKRKMKEKAQSRTGKLNSSFGTCWITNEKENKKIRKTELNEYLSKGWKAGRKIHRKV